MEYGEGSDGDKDTKGIKEGKKVGMGYDTKEVIPY
jgi:hypothetical protein